MLRLASRARIVALTFLAATGVSAQTPPASPRIATDPDVLGAQRLFSAWLEGQIAYRGRSGDSQVVLLNQSLVIITPNATSLDNRVTLEPIGNGLFRFVATSGNGPVGEVVRFVEEGGRVVRMITGDSYVERVKN